jgi:hypothetical protein
MKVEYHYIKKKKRRRTLTTHTHTTQQKIKSTFVSYEKKRNNLDLGHHEHLWGVFPPPA